MRKEISMFGDLATVDITFSEAGVSGVRLIATKQQRVARLIEAVDKQLKSGRSLVEQNHNLVALIDLTNALMDEQFRHKS